MKDRDDFLPMTSVPADVYRQVQWLSRFRPEKRILNGRIYRYAKRVFDLSLCLATVPIWIPALLVCALVVKLETPKGSVFFYQLRTGKNGRRFRMYKFRTMVPNAEEMKKQLNYLNELKWPDFKITDDPRVTRLGRLLRRTSLDELPQMFNVLLNDMSLVGPRPTSFSPSTYSLWHTERLDVEPGLTGLWQICGRGTTDFDDRLRMDIAYIEHRCLLLDMEILLRTFTSVLSQRGAH